MDNPFFASTAWDQRAGEKLINKAESVLTR